MKRVGYRPRIQDTDVVRKIRIDTQQPRPRFTAGIGIEVNHLTRGMHTGICATCADTGDAFVCNATNRLIQAVLNAGSVGLNLPTAIRSAIVLDTQCDALCMRRIQIRLDNNQPT